MTKHKWLLAALALGVLAALVITMFRGWRTTGGAVSPPPGVSEHTILIGSSLALGGHAGSLGTETLRGSLAYLRYVNDQGGVNGRRIEVRAYDDGYDPPRTLANTLRLIRDDRVFALFDYVGTPTTVEVLPVIREARIPLVGIFSGAQALRQPFQRYVINVRCSYYQETAMLVTHLVEDLGFPRIAVFYQYDAYGLDGLTGTEIALARYHLKPVATGGYGRGTEAVAEGLSRIEGARPQAVIMVGTYDACARLVELAHQRGFRPLFLSVSFVGAEQLTQRLGKDAEGMIVSQVVPPPTATILLPGAREYVKLLGHYFPGATPSFEGFEGYLNARVLVEGLKRAGPNLDRERFIDSVETMRDYSLGVANTLTFGPGDHEGLQDVYMTIFKGGLFHLVTSEESLRQDEGQCAEAACVSGAPAATGR